jgi:hypothetical protein
VWSAAGHRDDTDGCGCRIQDYEPQAGDHELRTRRGAAVSRTPSLLPQAHVASQPRTKLGHDELIDYYRALIVARYQAYDRAA